MLATERTYLRKIRMVVNDILKPLKDKAIIPPEQAEIIFGNV